MFVTKSAAALFQQFAGYVMILMFVAVLLYFGTMLSNNFSAGCFLLIILKTNYSESYFIAVNFIRRFDWRFLSGV